MRKLFQLMIIALPALANAQPDTFFRLQQTIPGEFTDFTVDNLGNLYLFSPLGSLKKIDVDGDSIAVFNDVRRYGKVYSVDVTNPLKVLLYYKDFGTVVVLDRYLNARNTIDLRKLKLYQVKAIGQSYDNGIWIFDEQEGKLKHISDEGRIIDQSTDFRQLFDSMPSPECIIDQNKNLYLYDSAKGVYLFDYYGAFRNRIRLLGWEDFTVVKNILFGRSDDIFYKYEPGSLDLREYAPLPAIANAAKTKITPWALYVLRSDRIEKYAYNR